MTGRTLAIAGAALLAGAYGLVVLGRKTTAAELKTDPAFAAGVAASLSYADAFKAGARALVGSNPLGGKNTVTATATKPTGFQSPYGWLDLM